MEKPDQAGTELPTPEQVLGRRLRVLRQERGWSQPDLAEKVRLFGYEWSQATITRLEAATRPIRVNELVALAELFRIPVEKLLEPVDPGAPWDDPEAMEREIASLEKERNDLKAQVDEASYEAMVKSEWEGELRTRLARVNGRLGALMRWYPRTAEDPDEPSEGVREQ
jgi:transcriptional regulator with XRE-family HTH domain